MNSILPLREALLGHRLYAEFRSIEQLQKFMEHHVFAVWDFMSLLKALQRGITCVETPWVPVGEPRLRRLVNEIVMGEESDVAESGEVLSHFELYLNAMREIGASTQRIEQFVADLRAGKSLETALTEANLPVCVSGFVRHTFGVIGGGKLHEIAAAFTYGREDLIPEMFGAMVAHLDEELPGRLTILRYYLQRHIELDGDHHGAMGREMVSLLCGQDVKKQQEAETGAKQALQARLNLWDGIADITEFRSGVSIGAKG
ncbi:MAG: DUF3050 domain-containing protein [Pedosphaera sp.]|nr:DUF3050 domain-containing protein [Pedosphaera sp.]